MSPESRLLRPVPGLGPNRRLAIASLLLGSAAARARPREVLQVTAFPLLDKIIEAAMPMWQRRHPDVAIQVVSRQYSDHHTAMTTALSTSGSLPDVMALESSFVGRFSQGGGLENLAPEPYDVGRLRHRLVPFAYDQAIGRGGAVVAVPADIGPGTLLYRTDLLNRSDVSEQDLTRSWDSYIDAGQRVRQRTGAYLISHVQLVKDILIRSGLQPGEGVYFDLDNKVLTESDRFVRAFEVARRVRSGKLDARVPAWSNGWAEGLRRGSVATELSGAWLVGQLSHWVAPQTAGLWRAAQLPEGDLVSYGGAFYAMPRRAEVRRKALAWDFIQLMTMDAERQLWAFKQFDAFPALIETHHSDYFDQPVAFLGGQPARRLWRDAALRIRANPVHKQNLFADEVVASELDNVLDRAKPIRAALADASRLLQLRARR